MSTHTSTATAESMPAAPAGFAAAFALAQRELLRFVRQPSRIVATVGTPILFWVFIASGFSGSIGDGSGAFSAYLLPGMAAMVILFSTIFASISLIQDRQAGFLQSVLVSPAPAWSVVCAKVLSGSLIATAQASPLLLSGPLVGLHPDAASVLSALAAAALTAVAVTSLGLAAAWWIDSTAGFHGVMNMVLMPMWLLSGSIFPVQSAAGWLGALASINPLRWSVGAIASSLGIDAGIDPTRAWLGAFAFAGAMLALAVLTIGRGAYRPSRDASL